MDSLTQITLGAAVGELVLGRKIGNRAMFWGAVGGTIPDLDVFAGFIVSPLTDLALHRGFSHSIAFSIVAALFLGYVVEGVYQSKYHKYFGFIGWLMIPVAVIYFVRRIFLEGNPSATALVLIFGLLILYLYRRYFKSPYQKPDATRKEWQWLFFWAFFTHLVLDSFTTYGTQVFQPFSNYRVAFNAISVADPLYTFPFLSCVIAAAFFGRGNTWRRKLTYIGIGLSSAYLLFTVVNKQRINAVFRNSLEAQSIEYTRYMTSPTILNNVLWYCLAETEDGYWHGLYSHFDSEKKVILEFTPRNADLIDAVPGDRTLKVLKWFSNDYYTITPLEGEEVQFNDMRFGVFDSDSEEKTYIFNFPIRKTAEGTYVLDDVNGGPPPGDRQEMLATLWERIKGI